MLLFEPLDNIIQDYLPVQQLELVKRAFVVAKNAHEGQFRSSGEPYITHPVAVAAILAELRLDHEAIIAALLHDVIEDTPYTEAELTAEFGKAVADIVEGVSKLDKLKFRTRQEAQAASFRKMILAMTKDIRVVLIKLADRTHNMRTLGALRPDKRRRIAKETLEIYSPLAHRLGIEQIKNELEDLCFQAMHPQRYTVLQKVIQVTRKTKTELVQPVIDELQKRLANAGIVAHVIGSEKPLYYIYQGIKSKEQQFDSIMDIYNFRIIVKNADDCYRALGQVHYLYKPRSGKIQDYIAVPKANGYQALHTSTIGPKGVPVKVQIRTEEMDKMAELGIIAHWIYSEDGKHDNTTAQIKAQHWLQNIIELQQSAGNSFEFIESIKSDLFSDEIYVFTPKGRIVELPAGATAVDFAYAVHSDIGRKCVGAKVDRMAYPLSQPLKSGQTVDILTSQTAQPKANWLNFVVTGKARSAIRQSLKHLQYEKAKELGKQQLLRALLPLTLEELDQERIYHVLADLKLVSLEELYIEIGLGNQLSLLMAHQLLGKNVEIDVDGDSANNKIGIHADGQLPMQFAQCCHPIPKDPIMAYSNPEKGLIIHHADCTNVQKQAGNQPHFIPVQWESSESAVEFEAELHIEIRNHATALAELMTAVSLAESTLHNIWSEENGNIYQVVLLVGVSDVTHLNRVMMGISTLSDTISVKRNINNVEH
ncbi:MAG: bifunctional GTP diphosphokinase/guanosine-3',5'-bis pyrophosphate 3'-pyrophosphohydrolase [Lonepinella koalarum]|nr:bifunctional GTP diphosphokinase/guanosine-3',5'-bis pyrophosphate 3'-pyrophosphohydrolase [Lonepinella koalarum]